MLALGWAEFVMLMICGMILMVVVLGVGVYIGRQYMRKS